MTHILLLLRLPFLFAGCALGGCIWWVTRRLYGNLGGYTALALYCFSPAVLKACVAPNPDVLAALGVFGGVYTCIGVAHAMQGPRRKWRPRIVLLIGHIRHRGGRAHRGPSRRRAAGPCSHDLDRRRPQEPGAARRARGHGWRTRSSLCLLWLLARRLQLCLSFVGRVPGFLHRSCPPLLLDSFERRRNPRSLRLSRPVFRRAASRATSATPFLCSARPCSYSS